MYDHEGGRGVVKDDEEDDEEDSPVIATSFDTARARKDIMATEGLHFIIAIRLSVSNDVAVTTASGHALQIRVG